MGSEMCIRDRLRLGRAIAFAVAEILLVSLLGAGRVWHAGYYPLKIRWGLNIIETRTSTAVTMKGTGEVIRTVGDDLHLPTTAVAFDGRQSLSGPFILCRGQLVQTFCHIPVAKVEFCQR